MSRTILQQDGCKVAIMPNDHTPAHVLIESAEKGARIGLDAVHVLTNYGFYDWEHQMTLKLYTDENIPRTVAQQLQDKGVDVLRCQDAGMRSASDADHLAFATAQDRAVVTADIDFLTLDAEYRAEGKQHTGIVYIAPDKKNDIGSIIAYVLFLYEAVTSGAADPEKDVYNSVLRV